MVLCREALSAKSSYIPNSITLHPVWSSILLMADELDCRNDTHCNFLFQIMTSLCCVWKSLWILMMNSVPYVYPRPRTGQVWMPPSRNGVIPTAMEKQLCTDSGRLRYRNTKHRKFSWPSKNPRPTAPPPFPSTPPPPIPPPPCPRPPCLPPPPCLYHLPKTPSTPPEFSLEPINVNRVSFGEQCCVTLRDSKMYICW